MRAGPVRAGVEALGAWGVGGDAARTPVGGSAWAVLRPVGPLVAWGRLDVVSEEPGNPEAVAFTFRGGAGVEWSPFRGAPPVLVAGGYEGGGAGPDATEIAGAEALSTWHRAFLLVGVDLSAAFPFTPSDPSRPRGAAPPSLP
ncbi:hypothetical protein L6R50_23730 [Myxococcota bacterium]|nr:hypothetical protein [Myxococcota bacterium]